MWLNRLWFYVYILSNLPYLREGSTIVRLLLRAYTQEGTRGETLGRIANALQALIDNGTDEFTDFPWAASSVVATTGIEDTLH